MEDPNTSHNPEQVDSGNSDEHLDDSENRSITESTSETPGDSHLESPVLDSHPSALVHINSACPTIDDLQSENDNLKRENRALEEEVAQYEADHLRELPEDHITDATAQRLYEGIQDAIEQWVYNVTEKSPAADWLNRYERRLRASIQDLKTGRAPAAFEHIPGFFRDPKACRASESIDCLFLSWFIAHSLAIYIFSKPYPIGIDGDQADFLDHAIEAMRSSECPYDEHYIDKWRTQTLAILMGHPHFGTSHKDAFDMEYERMHRHLLQWLPKEDVEEHKEEFKEGIFREAVMLQQKMGLAADDYRIAFGTFHPRSAPHRKATYRNLFNFRPIDARDVQNVHGCLFPSLCRIDFRDEPHHITKPVFIADPAPNQSPQQWVESRTKARDRELTKSPTEPIKKSNERPSGWSHRSTDIDRENSPRRRSKLSSMFRTSSSTQ